MENLKQSLEDVENTALLPAKTEEVPEAVHLLREGRRPNLLTPFSTIVLLVYFCFSVAFWGFDCRPYFPSWRDMHSTHDLRQPLVWGDINIIHTTDTHGWLLGHQKSSEPEPNGSGTLGDLYSFISHMKAQARERGVDLLVVDSGDLHDGNGLSDGFPDGGVDGHETNRIITEMPYDVLAIGNHELYKYEVAHDVHTNFAPKWNGRFLTSNVNITVIGADGSLENVPIGERYAKFTTAQGRKVTALGVLLDFDHNDANTTVQRTVDMLQESWFREVIQEDADLFLLAGHMGIRDENWQLVLGAIRDIHSSVPILILGGHLHERDCLMLDDRSMALESGRYMETVGWMSVTFSKTGMDQLLFSRRYLDNNRATYQIHTATTRRTFDTPQGVEITRRLHALEKDFHLNATFGHAPQDYYLDRVPYTSDNSVVSLFVNKALPTVLPLAMPDHANVPYIIITNSGAQRFDLFKGAFTRNDQFIVSPFTDNFWFLPIPYGVGRQVLDELLKIGAFSTPEQRASLTPYEADELNMDHHWRMSRQRQWNMIKNAGLDRVALSQSLTLGYVTTDSCPGGRADDTLHRAIPYFEQPGYVSSTNILDTMPEDALHDLIFNGFFKHDVVKVVNELRAEEGAPCWMDRNITLEDIEPWGTVLANEVFGHYARIAWRVED